MFREKFVSLLLYTGLILLFFPLDNYLLASVDGESAVVVCLAINVVLISLLAGVFWQIFPQQIKFDWLRPYLSFGHYLWPKDYYGKVFVSSRSRDKKLFLPWFRKRPDSVSVWQILLRHWQIGNLAELGLCNLRTRNLRIKVCQTYPIFRFGLKHDVVFHLDINFLGDLTVAFNGEANSVGEVVYNHWNLLLENFEKQQFVKNLEYDGDEPNVKFDLNIKANFISPELSPLIKKYFYSMKDNPAADEGPVRIYTETGSYMMDKRMCYLKLEDWDTGLDEIKKTFNDHLVKTIIDYLNIASACRLDKCLSYDLKIVSEEFKPVGVPAGWSGGI
jgi:hypothetical protein